MQSLKFDERFIFIDEIRILTKKTSNCFEVSLTINQ